MNGQNRFRALALTCAEEQERQKKTKKVRHLTLLGVAGGEAELPDQAEIFFGPCWGQRNGSG